MSKVSEFVKLANNHDVHEADLNSQRELKSKFKELTLGEVDEALSGLTDQGEGALIYYGLIS